MKREIIVAAALLASPAAMAQNADQLWEQAVNEFAAKGAKLDRYCYPKTGTCTRAMTRTLPSGSKVMLIGLESIGGNVRFSRRLLCAFNEAGDGRECIEFERGVRFRQIMNTKTLNWGPEVPVSE